MTLPPYGICLPVRYRRCRDGDTVEVSRIGSEDVLAIRLLDCWCKELHEEGGKSAKRFAEEAMEQAEQVSVFIPFPEDGRANAARTMRNWIKTLLSFDRILGYVFLRTDETLNERMVRSGHATKTKR